MTNVGSRIASKALDTKMEKILTALVKTDQTGYVDGECIALLSDILEYAGENQLTGILFSANFEEAFDSIEHAFIFATLQSFEFRPEFIQWVRTFLRGVENCYE